MAGQRTVPPQQLSWLRREVAAWRAEGLVDDDTARAIQDRYVAADRRAVLGRMTLLVGGGFVGVGLIWLVAANVDRISPLLRFVGITGVWLVAVAVGEVLAGQRRDDVGKTGAAGVEAARLVAALAYGGVVFQAAQSLQVPAYHSGLLGVWAAGALAYAYAGASLAPLLLGLATGVGWYGWVVGERSDGVAAAVLALLLAAVLAAAAAVLHGRWRTGFAAPWRQVGALLGLVGLFVVALPVERAEPLRLPAAAWVVLGAVVVAVAAAAYLGDRTDRLELLAAGVVLAAGLLLGLWDPPPEPDAGLPTGEGLGRALAATTVFLLAAGWYAALGVLREARHVTALATAALVVFVTVQSFAVFEPILSGAALFLVLGGVLLATGWLAHHGRRRLTRGVTA